MDAATAGLYASVRDGHEDVVRQLLATHSSAFSADVLQTCVVLAAYLESRAGVLRILLESGASSELPKKICFYIQDTAARVLGPIDPCDRELLRQPPVVIAACKLRTEVVQLLLERGAELPAVVGTVDSSNPLLAYWAHKLPAEPPATAQAVLGMLLNAGADPLHMDITPRFPDTSLRGRAGAYASFMLTCRSLPLLGVAVRHVLGQCRGSRELTPSQMATMVLAARLAGPGLEEQAEQLLAQAVLQGNCFPAASVSYLARGRASGSSSALPAGSPCKRQHRARHAPGAEGADPSARSPGARGRRRVPTAAALLLNLTASDDAEEAGPSSGPAGGPPPPLGLSPSHRLRQEWLTSQMRWQQRQHQLLAAEGEAAAAAEGAAAGEEGDAGADRAQRHRQLRAQLVADAAMHGLGDVLALLISQGASPDAAVGWSYPPEALPPPAQEVPSSLPSRAGDRTPLALAAAGGHHEAVAVLLRCGAFLNLAVLRHSVWALSAAGVEALLSRWAGGLPPTAPSSYAEGALNCPILLLLRRHLEACAVVVLRCAASVVPLGHSPLVVQRVAHLMWNQLEEAGSGGSPRAPPSPPVFWLPPPQSATGRQEAAWAAAAGERAAPQLLALEQAAVSIMDQLYAAGARINVYRDMCGRGADGVWRMGRFEGLQPDELEKLQVEGRNRQLWDAYSRPAWSKDAHRTFHPRFKAAAKTILLMWRHGEDKAWAQAQAQAQAQVAEMQGGKQQGQEQQQEEHGEEALPGPPMRQRTLSGDGEGPSGWRAGCVIGRAGPGASSVAMLARLPEELLLQIISTAAYPLSLWVCQ